VSAVGERPSATVRVLAADVDRFRGNRAGLLRVLREVAPDVALLHRVPTHPLSGHRLGALASDVGLVVVCAGKATGGAAVFTSLRLEPTAVQSHAGAGGGLALVTARLTGGHRLRLATIDTRGEDRDQVAIAAHLSSLLGPPDGVPTVVAGPLPGSAAGDALSHRFADLTPGAEADEPADRPRYRRLGLLGREVDARAVDLPGEPGRRPELLAAVLPARPTLVEVTLV
jgi:hypothetical protein